MRTCIFQLMILMFLCTATSVYATECGTGLEDNEDGTITDSNTGLTWKQCLEGLSGNDCATDAASTLSWTAALALDDGTWRLPNIKELQSIADYGSNEPALNTTCFPTPAGTANIYVWSSSLYAGDTENTWVINFKDGLFWNLITQSTSSLVNVRLVCDGDSAACPP